MLLASNTFGCCSAVVLPRSNVTVLRFQTAFMDSPSCDLFVAGFPCQPFSSGGVGLGVQDPRGTIIYRLIAWIEKHRPLMFILENVRGLVERHSETFAEILFLLTALQCYEIKWGILSAHTHGNVPQHRERVFITGILQEKMVRPFMWPQQVPLTNVIDNFIQPDVDDGLHDMVRWPQQKTLKRNLAKSIEKVIMDWGENPLQSQFVADIGCGPSRQPTVMKGICPCLTVARAGSYGYWLTWKNRFLRTDEIVMLMGVNPADLPPAVVSDRTLRQVAGNAMVVPVLSRLIRSMLHAVDL